MAESYIQPTHPGLPVQHFLTIDGTPTGTFNAIGNYAAAPVDFYFTATKYYILHSVLVNISDNANFAQTDYGGLTAGTIINGAKFFIQPNGAAETPLLSGFSVKRNYEWGILTKDIQLTSFAGLSQTLIANFAITEQYGTALVMHPGDTFKVRLNDNFTGLVSQTFGLRGIGYW